MAEVSTIPAYILSNENLLFWMLHHPLRESFHLKENGRNLLREFAYVDFHRWNTTRPDHVFRHRWKNFTENYLTAPTKGYGISFAQISPHNRQCSTVLAALKCLSDEYIELRNERMHVKLDKFGWWQNMLSRMSALPVQSMVLWLLKHQRLATYLDDDNLYAFRKTHHTLILYPYDAGVENYISRNGINDSHVHVNLCAHAEECWLNALAFPEEEWLKQQKQYEQSSDIAELYREIHVHLTPKLLWHDHLKTACRLRYLLIAHANDKLIPMPSEQTGGSAQCISAAQRLNDLADAPPRLWDENDIEAWRGSPEQTHEHDLTKPPDVLEEIEWMILLIHKLAINPDPLIDRAFHIYILIMNELISFCVQRDNMYGFKQFQKYSKIKTSMLDRQYYYYRVFERMHGNRIESQANYMELRFAPGKTSEATEQTIQAILHGYYQYVRLHLLDKSPNFENFSESLQGILVELDRLFQNPTQQPRLIRPALVVHLIKQPWARKHGELRYGTHRAAYSSILEGLNHLLIHYPRLKKWVCGIDAAADELDTPPDVFAPAYRKARRELHIPHATYHAGEDFYHLISGIRSICEAINFLELKSGDRIGHGTALGVEPVLWLKTMPSMVTPTRGEWLQDLIFTWNLMQGVHDHPELVQRLNIDIREQGYTVFHTSHLSPYILKRVFDLRKLDPATLVASYKKGREILLEQGRNPESMRDVLETLEFPPPSLSESGIEEEMTYEAFNTEAPEVIDMIIKWQQDEATWERSEQRIEVPTDYFSPSELLMIQQLAMKLLVDKAIVLETLPSSNLRIGQYKEMGQHHSLRWLGVPRIEGDSAPLIVLGSDDPGVFATDIKAEFYHLFASLRKRGLNAQDALEKLIKVDENGNRYAFRSLASNAVE